MHEILVKDAMTPADKLPTVKPAMLLPELARLFQQTSHHGFMVLDDRNEVFGIVTLADLERALEKGKAEARVRDICTKNLVTAFPDETLDDALRHFGELDVGRIPVVDSREPRRLLGVLRRGDIVHAYSRLLVDKNKRNHRLARLRLEAAAETELVEVDLRAHDAAAGKRLKELSLPPDCVIVSIRRGRRAIVPRGNTQLLAGDRVIAFPGAGGAETLRKILREAGVQSEKHTA